MNSTSSDLFTKATYYAYINSWYIIPCICVFGVITNLICCVIFLSPKFKLKIYSLLFWKSFFNMSGLVIQAFTPVTMSYEYIGYAYATMVYRWLFKTWVYNAFCMAAVLCNLAVSFDRLIMISNRGSCFMSRIPVLALVAAFFVFSLACFFFPIFAYEIKQPDYYADGYFALLTTRWGRSFQFAQVRTAMFCIRDIVLWILFVAVNTLLLYKARKVFRRKANLTAALVVQMNAAAATTEPTSKSKAPKNLSSQAERRMTYMVVVMSAVLAFGQMPYFINILMNLLFDNSRYLAGIAKLVNNLAFDTLYFSFSISPFIYYLFDKNFKSTIDTVFKRIRCSRTLKTFDSSQMAP